MFTEDDLLPISALQHLAFCERQCALIHIEQVWDENRLTAEGRILHERVHGGEPETRQGVHVARGLRLRSLVLGLAGIADVVEFHRDEAGIHVHGLKGMWRPFPVEFKRGKPKRDNCDAVQLCAQAICLEEMLGVSIPEGALFYGLPRRRQTVVFDEVLRAETTSLAARAHTLIAAGQTPEAVVGKHCKNCSLERRCLPKLKTGDAAVTRYMKDA